MSNKVAVALSGGVDSAVAAAILLEQGYEVIGVTGKMFSSLDCEQIILNAKNVANKLNIKHYIVDLEESFKKNVIDYFVSSYSNGITPNPCIMCNKLIKWGKLFEYINKNLGIDNIATGHYANIIESDGFFKLFPAKDEKKDQLYFLFLLTQEHLSRTLFPLARYKKEEVREFAKKLDLPSKSAKESQDICFIKPSMTTKKYLNNLLKTSRGLFVEKKSNKVLGEHDGCWQYTIGQRKGIGIAAPKPLYVVDIDAKNNVVYLGYNEELFKDKLILNNFNWSYLNNKTEFEAFVKIRYNMNAVLAEIFVEKDSITIRFKTPVAGITPGQACVLYDKKDGHLIGGGFI